MALVASAQALMEDDLELMALIEDEGALTSEDRPKAVKSTQLLGAMLLILGITGLLAMACGRFSGSEGINRADVASTQSLVINKIPGLGTVKRIARFAQIAGATGKLMEETKEVVVDAEEITEGVEALVNETAHLRNMSSQQLMAMNNLTDGNACPDGEEEFEGLCYDKCQALTKGEYPIRSTAFSCCKALPCTFLNSLLTSPLKPCQGLDVGGRTAGCPHTPGDCLANEEFHLGACYKKCTLLTDVEFPYRSGPDTCCKATTYLECLDASNSVSQASYNIGGGAGTGDAKLEAIAARVHTPIPSLAEAQTE
jgi:hypothetical protein